MSDTQLLNQLKFRVTALQSNLSDKQKQLQEYKTIESQADGKIKAMTKMHAQKVKTLLNSIQVLKKQKAAVEGLSKQHKRSKLIEQLNKQILDQDIVIEVLRNFVYEDKGKDKGRQICDEIIVKTLTKGPERIRPLTREELRMEIQKLKNNNLQLEGKLKVGVRGAKINKENDGDASEISSVTERSFVNQNQQIFKKLKNLQCENEELKLELGTKGRIIEKLKNEVKQKDKLRGQCELMVNELQISQRKISTFERLLRESKQTMNNKIMQLYERELRVQELQLNTRDTSEKLKQAHESTNILVQEIKQEKEQLQTEFDLLKKENEGLMLENITLKKRQDEQKNKIGEIRDINNKNKEELSTKLKDYQQEIDKVLAENQKLTEGYRILETKLFKERAEWVEQKSNLIAEIEANPKHGQISDNNSTMEQIDQLRKENRDLKQALQSGGSGSDSKMLLARMEAYRLKLEYYESKDPSSQRSLYDQLFTKYTDLLEQFQNYKKHGPALPSKKRQKVLVDVTSREQKQFGQMSSGISKLHLDDIDSDILDNFDSSYEYEMRLNEMDRKKMGGLPFMSEQDKQLLKLLNSNLWEFVKDDKVGEHIEDIISVNEDLQRQDDEELQRRILKLKNLSHPMGQKLVIYDSEIKEIDAMSDGVSVTSAVGKQIDKYDSDIDIEVKRGGGHNPKVNLRGLKTISDSYSSDQNVSSLKSGDSSFSKRKKGEKEKATVIKINKGNLSGNSSNGSFAYSMNSDVSSININESVLEGMNSDISVDFRKKKAK